MTEPWLSIITVVKDDPAGFRRTIESLLPQDLIGVEVVVVDGSADRQVVESVLRDNPTVPAEYGWEAPAGVYPAMNSALGRAHGEYAYFLNAGDRLHDPNALVRIRELIHQTRPAWLYAQVCFIDELGIETTPPPFDYSSERAACFARGRFPPHQGVIADTDLIKELGGFDTSYLVAADYALILRLAMHADPVESPIVLADFSRGGLSTTAWRRANKEFHRARRLILNPSGLASAREYGNTLRRLVETSLFNVVVEPHRARRLRAS